MINNAKSRLAEGNIIEGGSLQSTGKPLWLVRGRGLSRIMDYPGSDCSYIDIYLHEVISVSKPQGYLARAYR